MQTLMIHPRKTSFHFLLNILHGLPTDTRFMLSPVICHCNSILFIQ